MLTSSKYHNFGEIHSHVLNSFLMSFVFPKDRRLSEGAAPVGKEGRPSPGPWPVLGLQCRPQRLTSQTAGGLGNDLVGVEEVDSNSSRGGGLGAERAAETRLTIFALESEKDSLSRVLRLSKT